MWNGIASVEVSPGSPYSAARLDGTPSRAHTDETLNVGQSGHTSDSERDFNGRSRPAGAAKRAEKARKRRREPVPCPAAPGRRRRTVPGIRNPRGNGSP